MQKKMKDVLENVFAQRVRANPRYSLRAFARDLRLAPSTLSEILKDKKGLSALKAAEVSELLRLPEWQATEFKKLAQKRSRKSGSSEGQGLNLKSASQPKVVALKSEVEQALTSPLDSFILECTSLKSFVPSSEWLSSQLQVPVSEIQEALQRLQNCGLLEIKDGKWKDLSPYFTSSDGVSSDALRRFQKNILGIMTNKISTEPLDKRIMKTVIFSVRDEDLQEARTILDEAIARILALSTTSSESNDHVMCFSSQLFFATKGNVPHA